MADLIARALGRAALRKADPERERQKRYNDMQLEDLHMAGMVKITQDALDFRNLQMDHVPVWDAALSQEKQLAEGIEELCFEDLAAVIGYYYPELVVSGLAFREQLDKLAQSDNQLSRMRLKYGWHDAAKVLPSHSRHVLIWTQRGEYRAYYDHVHDCWRTTRDGLRITHWREQCGPEDWPAAK